MKRKLKIRLLLLAGILMVSGSGIAIGDIANTRHNLSASGPGEIKAKEGEETRICIFCHTPHGAREDIPFLWNRSSPTATYTPYKSSTLKAEVGQPTGASKMCLSCHDGTIALGALVSEPEEIPFVRGIRFMPDAETRLGTDLSDDHPISFVYDGSDQELASTLPATIQLEQNEQGQGLLQCTACHDPHDDANGKFLVMSNQYSALCTTCHVKTGWPQSSHESSTATWNGIGTNPWLNNDYTTVSENGCENCHRPHTAGAKQRLLKYFAEEDNCLVCHNGKVASTDIESELTNSYTHPVGGYPVGSHDAAENSTTQFKIHVECEDCHNPHQAKSVTPPATAPSVSGPNIGVWGINAAGNEIDPALNQYEICFKCHGDRDNNVISSSSFYPVVARQINQLDTRLEFASATSFHPVVYVGANGNVPSLISPYTTNSIIYCTDCHNTDDTTGPKGPHGSMYEYLLERNYQVADSANYSSNNYDLCYKCHSESSILNDDGFELHKKHIENKDTPCSVCHDAHGSENNTHLINFKVPVVSPNNSGSLYFEDRGTFSGACFLKCHNKNHNGWWYTETNHGKPGGGGH